MTDTNGSGGSGSDDTGNDDAYPPNRVPQPTCVFSVCSCPPGALGLSNSLLQSGTVISSPRCCSATGLVAVVAMGLSSTSGRGLGARFGVSST